MRKTTDLANNNYAEQGSTNDIDTVTAFRLPVMMLWAVDQWCTRNDVTRSQFLRRSVKDRLQSLGVELTSSENFIEERNNIDGTQ